MFTAKFWKAAAERAIKTGAQAVLGIYAGQSVFNLWDLDPGQTAGVAAGAAFLSVLTSLVSEPFGPGDSPAVVD